MNSRIKNRKLLSVLLLLAIAMSCIVAALTVYAGAESDSEGMSFTSSDMYQTLKSIPSHTSFTFETELYIPSDFGDTKRAFNIIGNWSTNEADRDKKEWSIELHKYGVVRLFHVSGKSIFFHDGDNTADITASANSTYLTEVKNTYYNNGLKPAFDVRGYMGTADNPQYAKIAVTADTSTGDAHLYINGNLVQSVYATAAVKDRSYTAGSKHPYHIIGGDYRDNNAGSFQGKIKNMAMYGYVRTPEQILSDATVSFSVDKEDANLIFAYDLTKTRDGFIEDISNNNVHASNLNWTTDEGRSFTADDELFLNGTISEMPRTYEAWIYPDPEFSRGGLILGNYGSGSTVLLNFEIHSSGKPSIYLRDENGNLMDKKFSYDIRRSTWAHLVITHETLESGGARFTCYVDGVKVESFDTELSYEFDPKNLSLLSLGGDSRADNVQYFKGRIKDVAWYSDVLTESEIAQSYKNGVNTSKDSLLLYYELDGKDGVSYISDSSGNGYDLHPIFYENTSPATDYAYSFAVVGDTQKLVYSDAYKGTDYTSYIYDWIVKNAESKKIAFVMGMGDITDKNGVDNTSDDGIDQTDIEWDIAKLQHQKLTDAGIPYGIIMGNHDKVAKLDEHFMGNANYQSFAEGDIGYYSGTSLGNYYVRFTVAGTKYMMIGLEYGANDNILDWAGEVIAANPDYRVIITTHCYMFRDGTTLDINDVVPPRKQSATTEVPSAKNNGDQIWTKLASQYENVIMVLSGHDPYANISWRQDIGVNGNTVTQFLVDPQGMSLDTGMVAMLYFSADGKQVQVEYISTYKTLEAQKTNANAKDVIYNDALNKFTFTIPEKITPAPVQTEYGTIPGAYASEITYPFAVFKADKTFIGAFGDLGEATVAAKAKGNSGNYVVLMRRDAEQTTKSPGLATITGSLTVDLGGYTLYKSGVGYIFDMYVDNNSSAKLTDGIDVRGTFSIINGNIVSMDKSHPLACVNYGANLTYSYSINFEFKNVGFTDLDAACHILDTWENGYSSGTLPIYANALFENCTFNYADSAADTYMIYLTNKDGKDRVVWDVEIRGGQIISDTAIAYDTFVMANDSTNGRADKIALTVNESGKYITQILPEGATDPSVMDIWVKGEYVMFFAPSETVNGKTVYELTSGDLEDYGLVTEYGFVPNSEIDSENYPILLFQNGEYIGRYSVFANGTDSGGVLSKVKALTDGSADGEIGSTVEILFIGDATATGVLPNVGQILGNVVIDLNGFSLIQQYSKSGALINTQAKNWKGMDDATFEIFNGKIVLQYYLLSFNAHGEGYNNGEGYKTFHMTFDNVEFSYVENSTATEFLGKFGEGSLVYEKKVAYDLSFNDCTFDFTNADSMALAFNANDNKITATDGSVSVNAIVNTEVSGGKIITANPELDFYETINNGSSVTFGKSDGKYIALELSGNEIKKISNSLITSEGITSVFADGTVTDGCVVYTLVPEVIDSYSVKSSISLWSNFVYNIYLLKTDSLAQISIDGETYDKSNLDVSVLDGTEYYLVKISLSAKESLRDIPLTLTLSTDGKSVKYISVLNVVKYANAILSGDHSEEEKTLLSDMLSYARAAYAYFETNDAEKLAAVDAILGEGYDEANEPNMTAEAKKPKAGRGFEDVTVNLGAIPSFVFYLSDGYTKDNFSFTSDGRAIDVNEGSNCNGAYLEVVMYAYRMCEDISYTVTLDGTEYTETFNIYSYYGYVLENHGAYEDLITLVERICKYSESAEKFRTYVVG